MTATATKTQYPDYREFGLYLLPRNYQDQYGFSDTNAPGRCLLLLDTKSVITPQSAKKANLRLLLQSDKHGIALYIVLPTINRRKLYEYPDQSELLQNLELAYVARNQVITPLEITQQFRAALGDARHDVANLLDFSIVIGINHNGETVFNSSYGRFIERQVEGNDGCLITERVRASLLPFADCLYALDYKGDVDDEALSLCVTSYLASSEHYAYDIKEAQRYAQMIFQTPPSDSPFKKSLDVAQSIISSVISEAVELDVNHWYLFNQMMIVAESAKLYEDMLNHDSYLEIFDTLSDSHNNRHSLHYSNGSTVLYKPSVPVVLAPILAKLLIPDEDDITNKTIYSPSIGDGSVLAGFSDESLIFNVNEPDARNYSQLNLFVKKAIAISARAGKKPSYFVTNKDLSLIAPSSDYGLSLTLLPAGVSPLTTYIPFVDDHNNRHLSHHTDRLDQSLIIEVLQRRESEGRSIFLGPIEDNKMGKVGRRSVYILQWLQAYFYNVSVVDLSPTLFSQNSLPSPNRLYVVGSKKPSPSNAMALHDRIGHIHKDFILPVITSYEQIIGLEQAISLIERSKRVPNADADIVQAAALSQQPKLESGDDDNDGDDDDNRIHFVDSFYNLAPRPDLKSLIDLSESEVDEVNDADNSTILQDDNTDGIAVGAIEEEIIEGVAVKEVVIEGDIQASDNSPASTDSNTTDEAQEESAPDSNETIDENNSEDESTNNSADSTVQDVADEALDTNADTDTETTEEGSDNSSMVVFEDYSQYGADEGDSDDFGGFGGGAEPDDEYNLDLLTGNNDALDKLMVDEANRIESAYMGNDFEPGEETVENESEETVENENAENESENESEETVDTTDTNEEPVTEITIDVSAEATAEPPVSLSKADDDTIAVDANDDVQTDSLATEKSDAAINRFYAPRFIDDPNKHLIVFKRPLKDDALAAPKFDSIIENGTIEPFSHRAAELKNAAMALARNKPARLNKLPRIKSQTIVETHLPAVLITNGTDIDTMEVISLIDCADSSIFGLKGRQYTETHGDIVVHEVFSLRSNMHQAEIEGVNDNIDDINNWLADSNIPTMLLNVLFRYDSHDFAEHLRLAERFAATTQKATRKHIKKAFNHLHQQGMSREREYQACWWMSLDDDVAIAYTKDNYEFAPNATLFSPAVSPAMKAGTSFPQIAEQIISLSHTNVYDVDFPNGLNTIAAYLVAPEEAELLEGLIAALANPKSLAFPILVSHTILCHAIFTTGAYRFFKQNCTAQEQDEWLKRTIRKPVVTTNQMQDKQHLAKLALDVSYSRSLLKRATPPFDSHAPMLTRYVSESAQSQSSNLVKRSHQPKIHHALLQMQALWRDKSDSFDMTSWFILQTLSDVKNLPSEVVDILFMATNNLLAKKPSYFSSSMMDSYISALLPLLAKVTNELGIPFSVCTTNKDLPALKAICDKTGVKLDVWSPETKANDSQGVLFFNVPYQRFYGERAIVIQYRERSNDISEVESLSLLEHGQLLELYQPKLTIKTKMLPGAKNTSVLSSVYEQYARVFDAMRQLKVLARTLAQDLYKARLAHEHDLLANQGPLAWWFKHQHSVIYDNNPTAIKARDKLVALMQTKTLSSSDELALELMTSNKLLQLPVAQSCDVDVWIDTLTSILVLSLNTPQLIVECLDNIKNGQQPILMFCNEQDALLQHILVVEQGATLPFTFFASQQRAIQDLKDKPGKTAEDQALLNRMIVDLDKGLLRRDDELSAIYQQEKSFSVPLINNALRCFLREVQQFGFIDMTGEYSSLGFAKEQSVTLNDSPAAGAFSQLVNTLLQMLDDRIITDLPLSPLDTITTQLSRHGYHVKQPASRQYRLIASKTVANELSLFKPVITEQVDARTLILGSEVDPDIYTHPTRQSVLMLASYPNSLNQLKLAADAAQSLSPLTTIAGEVSIWLPEPLCQADAYKAPLIGDYFAKINCNGMTDIDNSNHLAARYYLATAGEYLDHTPKSVDMLVFLALLAQLPLQDQERHLSFFDVRRQVQCDYDLSKKSKSKATLPQSVFSRRYSAITRPDYSVNEHLLREAIKQALPPAMIALFAPARDYIHDTYAQASYKPVSMTDVTSSISALVRRFKDDLFAMVDTHPHKSYLYQMLSDHDQSPEADYFIELSDNDKKAYVYKHLIKDMAYRGILSRIRTDLYEHQKFNAVDATTRLDIARKLNEATNDYACIEALCLSIQAMTGISSYVEQLQAQARAKHLIDERIDAICLLSHQAQTPLNIPVLVCQPNLELGDVMLSQNLPAIHTIFGRYFSNKRPIDSIVFLGKNEWLITCGITLPHYSQMIDLNNLVCHVINIGADKSSPTGIFQTNARHLYVDYVDKKALAVSKTHTITQGELCADFEINTENVSELICIDHDVMATSHVVTWSQLQADITLYHEASGVSFEQLLIGHGVHSQYCADNPELFEYADFHDVAGKHNQAIKMTNTAKALYTDFTHLFDNILPLSSSVFINYFNLCVSNKKTSLALACHSTALNQTIDMQVVGDSDKSKLIITCNSPALVERTALLLSNIDFMQDHHSCIITKPVDMRLILDSLGASSQWVHITQKIDSNLVLAVKDESTKAIKEMNALLTAIPIATDDVKQITHAPLRLEKSLIS